MPHKHLKCTSTGTTQIKPRVGISGELLSSDRGNDGGMWDVGSMLTKSGNRAVQYIEVDCEEPLNCILICLWQVKQH